MTADEVRLQLIDATELAEMLSFVSDWLAGPDRDQLADSFTRFIGTDGDHLTELRADLARFSFLLGHDDGEQLFGVEDGEPPHDTREE
jgi:hypothetical protein